MQLRVSINNSMNVIIVPVVILLIYTKLVLASLSQEFPKCSLFSPNSEVKQTGNTEKNFWANRPFARWPGGIIPYALNDLYTQEEKAVIHDGISEWETKTCIRFREKTSQDFNYVEITPDDGTESYCYCYVGRIGGKQIMKMFGECMRRGAMVHELGHVIGFNHEHQRPDRNDYLNIYLENVDPDFHYAFDPYTWNEVTAFDLPYDYKSVMQYPFHAFTGEHNPAKPAMTLKDGSIDEIFSEALDLSLFDVQKVHAYYNNCES